MANWYSNVFQPDQTSSITIGSTLPTVPATAASGIGHSRLRWKRASVNYLAATDLADDDVIRWFPVKSGDRPIQILVSSDADWGATSTFNCGLHLAGNNHDGAVVDEDLFATAYDIAGAIERVDILTEAALTDMDRGRTLYGLLGLTEDPLLNYELTFQATANISVTSAQVNTVVEMIYVSGD